MLSIGQFQQAVSQDEGYGALVRTMPIVTLHIAQALDNNWWDGCYFCVTPHGDTVTVGITYQDHLRWIYKWDDLPLDKLTYYEAENLYKALCNRGVRLIWAGTKWF